MKPMVSPTMGPVRAEPAVPTRSVVAVRPVPRVAIVHDYLTQMGGAERVVLAMSRAFPEATVHTALYDPGGTFPEFADLDVRTLGLNRFGFLRRDHRRALPVLARAFAGLEIDDADVVLCSSSGWAHMIGDDLPRVVYCHHPARWLHRPDPYVGGFGPLARAGLRVLGPGLRRRDHRAMLGAGTVVANSNTTARMIRRVYGLEARVVAPAGTLGVGGVDRALGGIRPGFVLCISRLVGHKRLDRLVAVARAMPERRFLLIGEGPMRGALDRSAPSNLRLIGRVDDDQLRWAYRNCSVVVSTAQEDFGLTPLEAAGFGVPVVVPAEGGFLDHVDPEVNGILVPGWNVNRFAAAVATAVTRSWDRTAMVNHARRMGEYRFAADLRELVCESVGRTGVRGKRPTEAMR